MVTHDAAAAAVAGRILFLDDGRIVRELADPDVGKVVSATHDLSER
jgi:ABC-type lipoprotein export system ATPase subunit